MHRYGSRLSESILECWRHHVKDILLCAREAALAAVHGISAEDSWLWHGAEQFDLHHDIRVGRSP